MTIYFTGVYSTDYWVNITWYLVGTTLQQFENILSGVPGTRFYYFA